MSRTKRNYGWPRLLRKADAAAYCSMSEQTFMRLCPVRAIRLEDRVIRWDREKIDKWIDGGLDPNEMTDEEWLAGLDEVETPAERRRRLKTAKKNPEASSDA